MTDLPTVHLRLWARTECRPVYAERWWDCTFGVVNEHGSQQQQIHLLLPAEQAQALRWDCDYELPFRAVETIPHRIARASNAQSRTMDD